MTSERLARALQRATRYAQRLHLDTEETLILTGSSVLPFATDGGDLDLVLVTPDERRFAEFATRRHSERRSEQLTNGFAMSYFDLDGEEADIEVWPTERVAAAIGEVGTGIRDVEAIEADFTRVGGLEVKVGTDLFHALHSGVAVHGEAAFGRLRSAVSWPSYQALKRDCALINVRDAGKGVPASLQAGQPEEAYLKLCWAADSLVDAMIFHRGLSIVRWKWRLRYLPLLDPWVPDWYRRVRLNGVLDAGAIAAEVDVLRRVWQQYAGTQPSIDGAAQASPILPFANANS
jgi:hypothetical protein